MKTSESIKEIASALTLAQAAMVGAKKGASNPFFKSKYSDLASVMQAISEPFAANSLSFIQAPELEDNCVTVTTRIMHSSGEWIESTISLPVTKNDAQAIGSLVSYGKRYGLQAMSGVPSVDDDAEVAVRSKNTKKEFKKATDVTEVKLSKGSQAGRRPLELTVAELVNYGKKYGKGGQDVLSELELEAIKKAYALNSNN